MDDGAARDLLERVKLVALTSGVRVGPTVLQELGGPESLTVHEYATTGGITLELPFDVLVNAPFDAPYNAVSPLELRGTGDRLELRLAHESVPIVRVVPLPGYLGAVDDRGEPIADVAMSHADRVRLSPIVGCAYDCSFCDLAKVRYAPRPLDQILRALEVARADAALPPRHVLISGGSPPLRHAPGQQYYETICLGVLEHVSAMGDLPQLDVDIMMSARADGVEFVERMVRAGVNGFSFNVEVFDDDFAARHLPLKHKWSRPHLESSIDRAVELLGWGNGRVRSLIIPGLEPVERTVAGVEWLASRGCSPVISPFRPAPGTKLEDSEPVGFQDVRTVLDEARLSADRHGVTLGPTCVPCQHNTATMPWDVAVPTA